MIDLKYALFSLNIFNIFENIVCYNFEWHFKGYKKEKKNNHLMHARSSESANDNQNCPKYYGQCNTLYLTVTTFWADLTAGKLIFFYLSQKIGFDILSKL